MFEHISKPVLPRKQFTSRMMRASLLGFGLIVFSLAIGMAQVYKKDIFFIAADSPFLFTWAANVLTQSRQAPVLVSKLLGVSAYLAPYSLSLSQAPPFSS